MNTSQESSRRRARPKPVDPPSNMPFHESTAKPLRITYTLEELQRFLRRQCPKAFAALPSVTQFTFSGVPDNVTSAIHVVADFGHMVPTCSKQLRLSPQKQYQKDYILLGGPGSDNILLHCASKLKKFTPGALGGVVAGEEWSIFEGKRTILTDAERKRLKALTCYLFLAAGHVKTITAYNDFEADLERACNWMKAHSVGDPTAATEVSSSTQANDGKSNIPRTSLHKKSTSRQQPSPASITTNSRRNHVLRRPNTSDSLLRNLSRMNSGDESDDEIAPPSKKTKHEDAMTKMHQRHREEELIMSALVKEVETLKRDASAATHNAHEISALAKEIDALKRALEEKLEKVEKLRSERLALQVEKRARTHGMKNLQEEVLKAQKAEAEETKMRENAERKLKEYVEAQKAMAARFGVLEG